MCSNLVHFQMINSTCLNDSYVLGLEFGLVALVVLVMYGSVHDCLTEILKYY